MELSPTGVARPRFEGGVEEDGYDQLALEKADQLSIVVQ